MSKPSLLTILQAAAALPSGELRVLIALIAEPDLTLEQLAEQVGVSARYLSNLLPAMDRRRIITRRARVIDYCKVEYIYLAHPVLNYESLAAEYLSTTPGANTTTNCSDQLAGADNGCQVDLNSKEA